MAKNNRGSDLVDGRLTFFQQFLRNPRQIGSITPSSRFLERRITQAAGVAGARTVVELGPGDGGTTQAILKAMGPEARLLSIERNDFLYALVRDRIQDRRFNIHYGDALDLPEILEEHGLGAPEAIISGIPFSTMPPTVGEAIVGAIHRVLAPGGRFVAYQVSGHVATLCRPVLGRGQLRYEFLNVPPARVYRWEKGAVQRPA